MRRRIVTLAALTLSLSAIGIAPLTAQATSGATESGTSSITASLVSSVDVTIPASLTFGALSDSGVSNVDYTFPVAYNGSGYTITFTTGNVSGTLFRMANSGSYIPYTIVGNNTTDTAAGAYVSGTAGPNITVSTADFKFSVAPFTLSSSKAAGSYADSLTVLVTAVP